MIYKKSMNRPDEFEGLGDSAGEEDSFDLSGALAYVPAIQAPLTRDDFEYYWSEELVVLYHTVKDHATQYGWPIFDSLNFCEFCKFAYKHSSKSKPAS